MGDLGGHRGDFTTDEAQQVDLVDEVGQDWAGLDLAAPLRGVILVMLACCPLAGDRHQLADAATLDDLAGRHRAGIIAPLMANQNLAFLLRGITRHLVGLLGGGCDRLFDQHRLAMAENRHQVGMVALCWGGNDHRLDI